MTGLVGILNVTEDSFSDGGRFLEEDAVVRHARALHQAGAEVVEIGPASSHPDAANVPADVEIDRIERVLSACDDQDIRFGVDSYLATTQIHCAERGVGWINCIQGFADERAWPALAACDAQLVVMHSVQRRGRATRVATDASSLPVAIEAFFRERIAALCAAGIARERLILDPGMGFFVGDGPGPSLTVLRGLATLRERLRCPVLVSVSRKSFLGTLTGRTIAERGSATLAAEIFAAHHGVGWIRTHDVAATRDALCVWEALHE